MEIGIMRNHYHTILAELEIQFQSIDSKIQGILHRCNGILRHESHSSPMCLNINITRHIHIIDPFLSETALHGYGNLFSILAWSRCKIMNVMPRELIVPDFELVYPALIGLIQFPYEDRRQVLYLLHAAHRSAIFCPFHLPGRIVVPYIKNNAVRMHDSLTWHIELHLIILVLSYRLVVPLQFTVLFRVYLISLRSSVITMVGIPPGSA